MLFIIQPHNSTRWWSHLRHCDTVYPFHLYPTGIPPLANHAEVELTVVYNACLCSFSNSRFSEAELVLKQAAQRGRPMLMQIYSNTSVILQSRETGILFPLCENLGDVQLSCTVALSHGSWWFGCHTCYLNMTQCWTLPLLLLQFFRWLERTLKRQSFGNLFWNQPEAQRSQLLYSVLLVCSGLYGWLTASWKPFRNIRYTSVCILSLCITAHINITDNGIHPLVCTYLCVVVWITVCMLW